MYVAYSSSNEFCEYTGISIISLFNNCKDVENLTVFLVNNGISDCNLKKIKSISELYNRDIILLDPTVFLNEISEVIPSFNGSYSTYCRLLCDKLYPDYVDKILIIDSDTIVNRSIKELENVDIEDKIIAAVENPDIYKIHKEGEEKNIITKNGFYFNAGILYVNLSNWRKKDFSKNIIESLSYLKIFTYADQTILNHAITKEDYVRLPYKFNYWGHSCSGALSVKTNSNYLQYFVKDEIEEADTNPIIIHYKGYDTRPWYKESISSMKDKFLHYKSISPWSETPLDSYFNDNFFKEKNTREKIKSLIKVKCYNSPLLNLYYNLKLKERG